MHCCPSLAVPYQHTREHYPTLGSILLPYQGALLYPWVEYPSTLPSSTTLPWVVFYYLTREYYPTREHYTTLGRVPSTLPRSTNLTWVLLPYQGVLPYLG